MSDTVDDEYSSLDTLLGKYGSSKAATQLARGGESPTDDYEEQENKEEYTSQFLKEIRERAQILSHNAAKTRKAALQHVVHEDSHTESAAGATSLDLLMDVIRTADISNESRTKAPTFLTSDDSLAVYSNEDLLAPVIPQDFAPWTREEEDTLNASHDYYKGPQIEPWGTSTTESYNDNDDDSDDSASTSEELIDSDSDTHGDDIDGDDNRKGPALDSKLSLAVSDTSEDYATSFTKLDVENEDDRSDQDSRFWPQRQASGLEDTGVGGYQVKAACGESDIDEEKAQDKPENEVLEEERRFEEDVIVVTLEQEVLPLDQILSNLQSDSKKRLEDYETVAETEDEVALRVAKGIEEENGLVWGDGLGMRQDVEDGTDEMKYAVDFNYGMTADPTGIQESDIDDSLYCPGVSSTLPVADIPFAGPLEDVGPEMIGMKNLEEMEGETKSGDASSGQQQKDPGAASVDKPNDSTSADDTLHAFAWNQEANEKVAENASCKTDFDEDVQERVSSFLDEMLGGRDPEERRLVDTRKDGDDMIQIANQDLSPPTEKPLLRPTRETISSEPVAMNEYSYEQNEAEKAWSVTRPGKPVGSVDSLSSLLTQGGEGPTDETCRIAPGEGTGNVTGENKMMQENLDSSTEIKSTNAKDGDVAYRHRPDLEVGQSTLFKESEETTQSPRLRGNVHPPVANRSSSTTKGKKTDPDAQDERKETQHTSQKKPANSKPTRIDVKPENLITTGWSREQHRTTEHFVKPKTRFKQTWTNTKQERNWNLGGMTENKNITHQAEHGKDRVNTGPYSGGYRPWPEQVKEVRAQMPLNQGDLSDESECPKGPGNVRSLIARFSSGSANASPAESPRSDSSFEWNVSFLGGGRQKPRERLTSTGSSSSSPDKKTNSPQLAFEKSSSKSFNDLQDIPWMQEVRERRRKREQGAVRGKLPR